MKAHEEADLQDQLPEQVRRRSTSRQQLLLAVGREECAGSQQQLARNVMVDGQRNVGGGRRRTNVVAHSAVLAVGKRWKRARDAAVQSAEGRLTRSVKKGEKSKSRRQEVLLLVFRKMCRGGAAAAAAGSCVSWRCRSRPGETATWRDLTPSHWLRSKAGPRRTLPEDPAADLKQIAVRKGRRSAAMPTRSTRCLLLRSTPFRESRGLLCPRPATRESLSMASWLGQRRQRLLPPLPIAAPLSDMEAPGTAGKILS
jgi:hypothetical protein